MSCLAPIHVKKPNGSGVAVPCGKCPNCKRAKISSWLFRLEKELEVSTSCMFVTLTYNQKNVPRVGKNMVLNPRDLTLWFKRLRKLDGAKIKYYAVGEYGSKKGRPHYHIILFNCSNPEYLQKAWGKGFVYSPMLNSLYGVKYVLKYLNKSEKTNKQFPEFTRISKGIGLNYLDLHTVNYHRLSFSRTYVRNSAGYRIAMPKYYKDKIFSEKEKKLLSLYMQQYSDMREDSRIYNLLATKCNQNAAQVLKNDYMSKFNIRIVEPKVDVL